MSGSKPLVSIITPSYNQGKFIEATLLSVKNQDYPDIEHIVVDGGSTDNTLDILKKYEGTYSVRWLSEPDRGQTDAVNKGFRMAKGEIVGWLNSDDVYFSRDVISYVVNRFGEFKDVDVVYGDTVDIDEGSLILRARCAIPCFRYELLLLSNLICQPSAFLRKAVVEGPGLDTSIDLPMDYEYWLRLAKNGFRFKHVNKVMAANRRYSATKTVSRWREMQAQKRKIQEQYGQKFNARYYLFRFSEYIFLMFLRIYATAILVKLFSNPPKHNLAFDANFDSILKAAARQLFYVFKL